MAAVMRHMLFRQHQKPDQPVRRDELNKIIQNSFKVEILRLNMRMKSCCSLLAGKERGSMLEQEDNAKYLPHGAALKTLCCLWVVESYGRAMEQTSRLS